MSYNRMDFGNGVEVVRKTSGLSGWNVEKDGDVLESFYDDESDDAREEAIEYVEANC